MSYKQMSEIVILNKLGVAGSDAKAELFETYDQLRDLTVSGPSISGSGLGPAGGFLFKLAQMLSGSSFLPILGNQSINIPGTSYYSPTQPGTGTQPGGQSSFGFAPFAQTPGFPSFGGSAAGINAASILGSIGLGSGLVGLTGFGDPNDPNAGQTYTVGGGAAPIGAGSVGGNLAAAGTGLVGASGFGRNFVMPAAGLISGLGGLLTSLSPLMGGAGVAGLAAGTILSGLSGSALTAYQHVSNRVLVNADTILSNKVKNLETIVKQLEAQEETVKKLLKDSLEGDKKALQDLS